MEESHAVAVGGDGRDFRGTLMGFAKADVGGNMDEEDDMEEDGDDDASLEESSSNMLCIVY